jgi:hypothetical protein
MPLHIQISKCNTAQKQNQGQNSHDHLIDAEKPLTKVDFPS